MWKRNRVGAEAEPQRERKKSRSRVGERKKSRSRVGERKIQRETGWVREIKIDRETGSGVGERE